MNRRNSVSILLAAVALLALTVPVPAFAQMKDMPMMQHGHGQMMEMGTMDRMDHMMGSCMDHADKMGLTDEQVHKMKPLHREMQKKQARFVADEKIAEIELMGIMDVKDFDLDKAGAAVKKIAEIKTAHHLEMLTAMKDMRNSLSDEQFAKMKKMMAMNMSEKKAAHKMHKKQK